MDPLPEELKGFQVFDSTRWQKAVCGFNCDGGKIDIDNKMPPACRKGVHACAICRKAGHGASSCGHKPENKGEGKGKVSAQVDPPVPDPGSLMDPGSTHLHDLRPPPPPEQRPHPASYLSIPFLNRNQTSGPLGIFIEVLAGRGGLSSSATEQSFAVLAFDKEAKSTFPPGKGSGPHRSRTGRYPGHHIKNHHRQIKHVQMAPPPGKNRSGI